MLKIIDLSGHLQSKLWILEILYCISMKVDLKTVYIEHSKFKSDIQSFTKDIT